MSEFGKGAELLKLESVNTAIDDASEWAGREYADIVRGDVRFRIGYGVRGEIESPIEAIFYAWFTAAESLDDHEVYQFVLRPQSSFDASTGNAYRFDFIVQFGPWSVSTEAHKRGIEQPKIGIELDGHDFHERTKEQVAYRNERDRVLQADGWNILHFSGSELYRDPLKCARSVIETCRRKHDEWSALVWGTRG